MKLTTTVLLFALLVAGVFNSHTETTTTSDESNSSDDDDDSRYTGNCVDDGDCGINEECVFPGNSKGNAWIKKCAPLCPLGWEYYAQSCYLVDQSSRTQPDSQAYCKSQGGDLVIISDAEEDAFVVSLVVDDVAGPPYWIGLIRQSADWVWFDGTVASYTNFERDDYPWIDGDMNCAVMMPIVNEWYNGPCSWSARVICEMPAYILGKPQ